MRRSDSFARSMSWKRSTSADRVAPRASRFISANADTDLPQPDSPTRQWVSPRSTFSDTPRTASVPLGKPTRRLDTSRTGLIPGSVRRAGRAGRRPAG